MNPINYTWFIPLIPALGFFINIVWGYKLGKKVSAYLSVALMLIVTVLAAILLTQVWQAINIAKLHEITTLEKEITLLEKKYQQAKLTAISFTRLAEIKVNLEQNKHNLHELIDELQIDHSAKKFPFTSQRPWLSIADEASFPLGLFIDPFAAVMVFTVAFICLLIHLFSIEYMAKEERYSTFFAYISLFSAAMLAMLLSRSLFHVMFFWEIMGVMSYLLIGFFYKKIAAQQAMKKAFLVTKLADIGLIIALFWIYRVFGTLDLLIIHELAPEILVTISSVATGIGLLLFLGAVGKSAQFPLHVWLLDAMEGPTPVSAMIHAATMVAAGVYLLARTYPILVAGHSLGIIALVGAITALFAACLAPFATDIKKILAWSTVSQLGFMFIGLGVFGWIAAVFHLLTHAFFKALLFLCSGTMIHSSGTQDIFQMNKLAKHMPSTRVAFIIGALCLAGVFPFAGFWSKDEILLAVQKATSTNNYYQIILIMAYMASFLTAFYITRAYIIAFEKPKQKTPWPREQTLPELNMSAADVKQDQILAKGNLPNLSLHNPTHESGWHMGIALWLLAAGAIAVGLLGSPLLGNALQLFVYEGKIPHIELLATQILGFVLSTLIALSGIGFGVWWCLKKPKKIVTPSWFIKLVQRRVYIDKVYYVFLAKPFTQLAKPLSYFDAQILDNFIDFLAWFVGKVGEAFRKLQTGHLEHYTYLLVVAALVLIIVLSTGLLQ